MVEYVGMFLSMTFETIYTSWRDAFILRLLTFKVVGASSALADLLSGDTYLLLGGRFALSYAEPFLDLKPSFYPPSPSL